MKKKPVDYKTSLLVILETTKATLNRLEESKDTLDEYYRALEANDPQLAEMLRETDRSMIEPLVKLLRYVQTKKEVAFAAPN